MQQQQTSNHSYNVNIALGLETNEYYKKYLEYQNPELDNEGLLLTMYDSRLDLTLLLMRLNHFHIFKTIIRNVRLSEAPSYGESIIASDAKAEAINYLNLVKVYR